MGVKSKVYIRIDDKSRIIACDGGYSICNIKNYDEWILVDEGLGDKYNLCQSNYFEKPLYEEHGIPVYKLENGLAVERTQAEIEDDIASMPATEPLPTVAELQAKVVELETAIELLVSGATEATA